MLPERNTPKAKRTRQAVLNAALALFQERGFEATTMRDIADRASLAVGATYYHFRTKDEIVLALYGATLDAAEAWVRELTRSTPDFAVRLRGAIDQALAQLAPCRPFLGHLAGHVFIPGSPLSPFSSESAAMRERAMAIMGSVVEGSTLKVAGEFRPHLQRLLWLYQMGITSYWISDRSPQQRNTQRLLSLTVALVTKLFAVTRVPILRQANGLILSALELGTGRLEQAA